MAAPTYTVLPALRCLRNPARRAPIPIRTFWTSSTRRNEAIEATATGPPPPPPLDPNLVSTRREERQLMRTGVHPIGSRRRRAALQSSDNVPFEQMPYQCFQEARRVLQEDRVSKLTQIAEMRKRIAHWQNVPAADCGGENAKKGKLVRMQKYLEELKILADVNDPVIKKRFEDGMGMRIERCFVWKGRLIAWTLRGYGPPHLPLPCRQEVARIQTPAPHATHIPNVHCSRYAATPGPNSRRLSGIRPPQRPTRRIRRFTRQRDFGKIASASFR